MFRCVRKGVCGLFFTHDTTNSRIKYVLIANCVFGGAFAASCEPCGSPNAADVVLLRLAMSSFERIASPAICASGAGMYLDVSLDVLDYACLSAVISSPAIVSCASSSRCEPTCTTRSESGSVWVERCIYLHCVLGVWLLRLPARRTYKPRSAKPSSPSH